MYVIYYAGTDYDIEWFIHLSSLPPTWMIGVECCWMVPGTVID